MSNSTSDVGRMIHPMKIIAGLRHTGGNFVGTTETMKDLSTAPRESQRSKETSTDTGIALSLCTAGIQE
jgi:hypothetical protein